MCKQQKLRRSKREQWVSDRQVCSGSGPVGCTVCQPAWPIWPGGCSVAHVPLVDASFPAWASFCHQSPPEQSGPRPVQTLLGVLLGKCLCPLWCHEAEQPVAQDSTQHQLKISNGSQNCPVTPVAYLQNLNVHHPAFMAQDSGYSFQVHTRSTKSYFFRMLTSVTYVISNQNATLFRDDFCFIVALISLELFDLRDAPEGITRKSRHSYRSGG